MKSGRAEVNCESKDMLSRALADNAVIVVRVYIHKDAWKQLFEIKDRKGATFISDAIFK